MRCLTSSQNMKTGTVPLKNVFEIVFKRTVDQSSINVDFILGELLSPVFVFHLPILLFLQDCLQCFFFYSHRFSLQQCRYLSSFPLKCIFPLPLIYSFFHSFTYSFQNASYASCNAQGGETEVNDSGECAPTSVCVRHLDALRFPWQMLSAWKTRTVSQLMPTVSLPATLRRCSDACRIMVSVSSICSERHICIFKYSKSIIIYFHLYSSNFLLRMMP